MGSDPGTTGEFQNSNSTPHGEGAVAVLRTWSLWMAYEFKSNLMGKQIGAKVRKRYSTLCNNDALFLTVRAISAWNSQHSD